MKVLFLNSPVLKVFEPWFDAPKFVRTALASLAGYVRAYDKSFEIVCLDAKFELLNFEQALKRVKEINPDVVCLTAFTNEIKPNAYLAGKIKKEIPRVVTIIGGAHLTAIPEQTMHEFPTFDIGVVGEGEETILELLQCLRDEKDYSHIKGLVYRNQEGVIIKNEERHRILNQDLLPMPAWDLFPPAEEYYIQSVRGCPFACVFCLNHNGKVARKTSVERVIEEMEWLIQYGAKRISFGDELWSVDMKRTSQLLDLMIEHKIGERVAWDVQTHVSYVNDELLEKMHRAKITKCEMGVEAGDENTLKKMGKATTKEMIIKAFKMAKKHGVNTGSFFILGQPNETYKTMFETIKFAVQLNPTEPIFGTMVPYPGTQVAYLAAKGEAGYKLVTTDWDEYRKQLNGSMELTKISRNALEWFQIVAYISVFIFNGRIIDFFKFFWSYKEGALNLFKKAILRKKNTGDFVIKPSDYDAVINSPGQISMEEIVKSRAYWKDLQSKEIVHAKKTHAHLLKEQIPI